jgi:sugar phosphate isomerase/epimerase
MKIAVFSAATPEYPPETLAQKLAEWGFDGVEWRLQPPPPPGAQVESFWKGNRASVDPATIVEQSPSLRALCRKHKLAMPVLGAYFDATKLDLAERVLEAADMMGSKGVRIQPAKYDKRKTRYTKALEKAVTSYEKLVKLSERYRARPLIEVHPNSLTFSAATALRFVQNFGTSDVGVIWDPGNTVIEGFEPPRVAIDMLGRYLQHVHVKNISLYVESGDPDGNLRWGWRNDTLPRGAVNWPETLKALKALGYRGWLSLEDFSEGPAEQRLPAALAFLKEHL